MCLVRIHTGAGFFFRIVHFVRVHSWGFCDRVVLVSCLGMSLESFVQEMWCILLGHILGSFVQEMWCILSGHILGRFVVELCIQCWAVCCRIFVSVLKVHYWGVL